MRRGFLPLITLLLTSLPCQAAEGDLATLAERLARRTAQLDRNAESARNYRDDREDDALRAIYMLDSAAVWFTRVVRYYGDDPTRTAGDYELLRERLEAARGAFADLRPSREMRIDLEAIDGVMADLKGVYEPASQPADARYDDRADVRYGDRRDDARYGDRRDDARYDDRRDDERRADARRQDDRRADARREDDRREATTRDDIDLRVDPTRSGRPANLPAGTALAVALEHSVRSRDYRAGERITARLADDVRVGGYVVVPAGARAVMRVTEMEEAGRLKGREHISLELVELDVSGAPIPVDSNVVSYVAEESTDDDAKVIGGSAVIGTIIGLIKDGGGGAAKGAVIGAAAGTGVVLATKGKTVDLPVGHRVEFTLDQPADALPPAEQR